MRRFDTRKTSVEEIVCLLREPLEAELAAQQQAVAQIVLAVRGEGDKALLRFARQFDSPLVTKRNLFVSEREFEAAYKAVGREFLDALRLSIQRVTDFHRRCAGGPSASGGQGQGSWFFYDDDGTLLGQTVLPVERVGCLVPGAAAPLASSAVMTVVPAKVAGVSEVIVATPPKRRSGHVDPHVLVAARQAGADRVLRAFGAHAVAALAYGTESVPKVDKIVGPGGIYVMLAKRMVSGDVGIESLPGPSEIMVLADETADAELVAADLLAQAEHGSNSPVAFVTPSRRLLKDVEAQLKAQLAALPRRSLAEESLKRLGGAVLVRDLEEGVGLANLFAPEHIHIVTRNPLEVAGKVRNAGAVLIGEWSAGGFADYLAGPSHVLPTGGTARFSSPLSVQDFLKATSVVMYSPAGVKATGRQAQALAEVEGLSAHARAVNLRLKRLRPGKPAPAGTKEKGKHGTKNRSR